MAKNYSKRFRHKGGLSLIDDENVFAITGHSEERTINECFDRLEQQILENYFHFHRKIACLPSFLLKGSITS